MRSNLLAVVMAVGVVAVPSSAWAGGGGTGSGGSTGGSDVGGDVGTGDGGAGSTGGGAGSGDADSCGTCEEPAAPVAFVSPLDGQEVAADLTVTVEVSYSCSCDTCGCYEDTPSSFYLRVDGVEAFACFDGCAGTQTVDLQLDPGTHQLTAAASYSFHDEVQTITVTVPGAAATGGSSDGSGEGTGGSDGGKGGCSVGTDASPLALGAWLLLLAGVRRRVRRRD